VEEDPLSSRIEVDHCPYCGYKCDAVTCIEKEGAFPRSGDITMCLNCGKGLIFDERLKMRRPTVEELEVMLKNNLLLRAQVARSSMNMPDLKK
jgi:uncharacterized protein YehS (DUF1456 family)